jgi:peroxiredoxin
MKKLLFILILLIGINIQTTEAQGVQIDENTIIKDVDGKKIDIETFAKLMNSGEWMMDEKTDDDGNSYIQVREATEKEKEMIKKMMQNHGGNSDLIGKTVKSFSLTDINGNKITSASTKGKVVVLNFWFIACKPCVAEIPELNKIYEKYKDNKEVVFASITFDGKEHVQDFLEKNPISYPVITDDKDTISDFGINAYPTNMVIGKDGKIADSITGGFPKIGEHIEDAIAAALKAE